MVKKYTLTVSDEEGARIDKWKESFNMSAVFRGAIMAKVEQKERFERTIKGEMNMEALVERLKSEKANLEDTHFDQGKMDGARWVQSATYHDLLYFDSWEPEGMAGAYDISALCNDEVLGGYFNSTLYADNCMKPNDDDELLNGVAAKWLNGWLEGASAVWDQIKSELN